MVKGAGELTERVTFEKADAATPDQFNAAVATWEEIGTRKCKVEALGSSNLILAGATGEKTTYVVEFYYWELVDVPCQLRLTWGGLTLKPNGRPIYVGRMMKLMCSEVQ